MAHPLVLSYSRAKALVEEYLTAHRDIRGDRTVDTYHRRWIWRILFLYQFALVPPLT